MLGGSEKEVPRCLTQLGFEAFSVATTLSIASCLGSHFPHDVFFASEGKTTSKKTVFLFLCSVFLTTFEFSKFYFYFNLTELCLMTMSMTTCPVSVIGHLSTLPLHAHYAIHLPFASHALTHPCFCPLLSTSLLLPTTLLLQASELNFCLSLLLPSILLIYSSSSSLNPLPSAQSKIDRIRSMEKKLRSRQNH